MSLKEFLKNRAFLKQLLIAVCLTIVIVFLIIQSLNLYTHHGQSVTVPDVRGNKPEELVEQKDYNDFEFIVVDSVYDAKKEKGSIISQDPFPNAKVKRNRKVYLTVVSSTPERVKMPNCIDLTMRQTLSLLETYGLQVGSLEFIPDIAKNAVIKQKYKGIEIEPGKPIQKGSKIDLVVGQGMGSDKIPVPFLLGKKQSEAIKILRASALNVGSEVFEDAKDTVHVRVYKQKPANGPNQYVRMGQTIDLWYRSDKKVDFDELIRNYKFDSTANNN